MKEITRDTLITGARIQSRSGRAVVIDLRQGALEEMGGGEDYVVVRFVRSHVVRRMTLSKAARRFAPRNGGSEP